MGVPGEVYGSSSFASRHGRACVLGRGSVRPAIRRTAGAYAGPHVRALRGKQGHR